MFPLGFRVTPADVAEVFRFRRVVCAALEDFGISRRPKPAVGGVDEVPSAMPPGVVWHGSAKRSPELQRFCDHLEAKRVAALS